MHRVAKWIALAVLAVAAAALGLASVAILSKGSSNHAAFRRVKVGMTKAEVERILATNRLFVLLTEVPGQASIFPRDGCGVKTTNGWTTISPRIIPGYRVSTSMILAQTRERSGRELKMNIAIRNKRWDGEICGFAAR
jgi:hypothetical protein